MDTYKLIGTLCIAAGALCFASCSSCSGGADDDTAAVSREVYDELQQKYDMLKESVEGTLSANEEARMELNNIMVELNTISGRTISLQQNVENGTSHNTRTTAAQISESIAAIKQRLNAVSVNKADRQTLALVENLRQTIMLNEQEIDRLNVIIGEQNVQISNLDTELAATNEQLRQTLESLKNAEGDSWISMGDELTSTADLLPDVKGHGNMKEIKQAKLTILLRAKAAYNQAYQLGRADAQAKIREVDAKYQQVYNR